MSTQYTNQQIRSAILRAADRIEREPDKYDFFGQGTKGCKACCWGWLGRELGMSAQFNADVSAAVGVQSTWHLYGYGAAEHDHGHQKAQTAPAFLRAYADRYWPAPALDPSYLKLRASLPSLAAQMRAEGKWQLAAVIEQDGAL